MCGIFAYSGTKKDAVSIVHEGLKRLDYRGYDSWGMAVLNNDTLVVTKHAGRIPASVPQLPESSIVLGHTRWATHGAVSDVNAHPHATSDNSFVLAQNGIVENFSELKKMLAGKGYELKTQTDTEVIVRLIEEKRKQHPKLIEAIRQAFLELTGRNTIIVLTKTGDLIACRNGSPLVIGIVDNDVFFSSDTLSFAPYTKQIVVIDNGQMVTYINNTLEVRTVSDNQLVKYQVETVDVNQEVLEKGDFPHYMIKEIFDEPATILAIINQPKSQLEQLADAIKNARTVYTIGSGTAGAAAAQIAYYLRRCAKISAVSLIGAEAKEYLPLFSDQDILIAPSQSGETADVLEIMEPAKKSGIKIASLVNMPGSLMTRLSDFKFMAGAGPEVCVLSTKVFIAQIAWGYLLAKTVAGKHDEGIQQLKQLTERLSTYLKNGKELDEIQKLAKTLSHQEHIFLLGKGQNLQMIKEGMIKIVEGAYIHAHAIPSGDLKHFAITLMAEGVPVVVVTSQDESVSDVGNAVSEVKARGATVYGIGSAKNEQFSEFVEIPNTGETSALFNVTVLQLLAYYMAVNLGHDVDKPRNIAKSVTVK